MHDIPLWFFGQHCLAYNKIEPRYQVHDYFQCKTQLEFAHEKLLSYTLMLKPVELAAETW